MKLAECLGPVIIAMLVQGCGVDCYQLAPDGTLTDNFVGSHFSGYTAKPGEQCVQTPTLVDEIPAVVQQQQQSTYYVTPSSSGGYYITQPGSNAMTIVNPNGNGGASVTTIP